MWLDDSGLHEGSVGMLFADGAVGAGWQGDRVLVEVDGGSRSAGVGEWQYRAGREVTGWLPRCSCGWAGHPWVRGDERWDYDPVMRVAYSPDSFVPEAVEDGPLYDEWRAHAVPLEQLGPLAGVHAEAGRRLDDAVAAARRGGASWAQIGAAVGITRQSAHERWARRDPS